MKNILGLIAGAFLIVSAGLHSVLGWRALGKQLADAGAPADLILGLQIGWHFAGLAMLAFGLIVLSIFRHAQRGETPSMIPVYIIAIAYLAFGVYALGVSNFNPFFFIFIVPGVLLGAAAAGRRS